MGSIPRNVVKAIERARFPDYFAGPMSRAMEDRRILAGYIDTLTNALLDAHSKSDGLEAEVERLRAMWQNTVERLAQTTERGVDREIPQ